MPMYDLTITTITDAVGTLNEELFNVNVLVDAHTGETPWGGNYGNEIGNPTIEALAAMDQFDVTSVRFPAGQDKAIFSETGMIVDGDLPTFLRNFLEYAQESGLGVNLVVPVESLEEFGGPSQAEILDGLEQIASIVARDFPGVVTGYELGNEYWGGRIPGDDTREAAYGEAAGMAAVAIQNGASEFETDPHIILQASGNLGGAFDNSLSDANMAIQDAFASVNGAMETVDGVLRNFYWRDRDEGGFDNGTGTYAEDRGIDENLNGWGDANWESWAGRELTTYVGEYNITNRVTFSEENVDIGVHGASMFLEHMTNMVEADVDVAFAWPFLHATRNSFILQHEDIEVTNILGMEILTNTTRGAMFDLLRQSIVGDKLLDIEWNTESAVEVTAFQDAIVEIEGNAVTSYTKTVFFSSRSDQFETINVDLSSLVSGYSGMNGISIFYEDEGNHHRDAILTEVTGLDNDLDGQFTLDLEAYEVVQLTFHFGHTMASNGNITFTQDSTVFQGSDGAETLMLNDGADTVHGREGNDWIDGGNGSDVLLGGDGNDTLVGGGFADTVFGGDGEDLIHGNWGRDVIYGGKGDDTVYSGAMDGIVYGEAGDDLVVAATGNDKIWGGTGRDSLYGSDGKDYISGGMNNDLVDGGSGNDIVDGGNGNDVVLGGNGRDRVFGGRGDDKLSGEGGADTLVGGDGDDIANGGNGNDAVKGGAGNDLLLGGRGNDRLFGEAGEDTLVGGVGDDLLRAGANNDVLIAGEGDDFLAGGAGFDLLDGGAGNDMLWGNFNSDQFLFDHGHGHDVIKDFEANNDLEVIDFTALDKFSSFAEIAENMVQLGTDVLITTSAVSSVLLESVDISQLDTHDFIF